MSLYALPRPYGGAASEPREPETLGWCDQCQDRFTTTETIYCLRCADSVLVHQACALDYLIDHEIIALGPVAEFLSAPWEADDA